MPRGESGKGAVVNGLGTAAVLKSRRTYDYIHLYSSKLRRRVTLASVGRPGTTGFSLSRPAIHRPTEDHRVVMILKMLTGPWCTVGKASNTVARQPPRRRSWSVLPSRPHPVPPPRRGWCEYKESTQTLEKLRCIFRPSPSCQVPVVNVDGGADAKVLPVVSCDAHHMLTQSCCGKHRE